MACSQRMTIEEGTADRLNACVTLPAAASHAGSRSGGGTISPSEGYGCRQKFIEIAERMAQKCSSERRLRGISGQAVPH